VQKGALGETYNIGGCNEWTNIDIVQLICDRLDEMRPGDRPKRELITYVKDRPGHDMRYAIDASKIMNDLGWSPGYTFETGIEQTLNWYLEHMDWLQQVNSGDYREYYKRQYG
jgi:dTDP-glucose 4,6-dehydratase